MHVQHGAGHSPRQNNGRRGIDRFGTIRRYGIIVVAAALHLGLILTVTIDVKGREEREDTSIFKLVDIREYVPPPPEPEPERPKEEEKKVEPEEEIVVPRQEAIVEEVIEAEEEVVETPPESEPVTIPSQEKALEPSPETPPEIEYLPQHKISEAPGIPTERIRASIEYPPLANRRGIEGVVYLELYIDAHGVIRDIKVLKDPGFGLAEAAVKALEGITVKPAKANGTPVAVRFRYPVRFSLK
jgi:periplasmic protein TonB